MFIYKKPPAREVFVYVELLMLDIYLSMLNSSTSSVVGLKIVLGLATLQQKNLAV